jgi:small subunit ribosomal protein S1
MDNKDNKFDKYIDDLIPEDVYKYSDNIKVGDIVEGKVLSITNDGVYVDIGSKTDGVIPIEEFHRGKEVSKLFKPQQIIKVYVKKLNYDNVHLLSYKKAKEIELFDKIKEWYEQQIPVDTKIVSEEKSGYVVDIGIDAFLPYREVSNELKEKIEKVAKEPLKIQELVFKVVIKELKSLENKKLDIVVSNKLYEEQIKEEIKKKVLAQIKVGDEVVATVKNLTSFGAFVDITGAEAFLHISNIAWYKLNHPRDVLHIGDKIKVKVLYIDQQKGKIEVGLKQLFPHPWEEVEKKYKIGEVVKCKITNITNFGLFVELEPAVEGLVHKSEVSWENKEPQLHRMFKIGQEIEAKVLNIDVENKKISLSIKKVTFNPWEEIKKEFPPNSVHKGKITKILRSGIYVSLKPGFDGFISINDISWTQKIKDLTKRYNVGEYVQYKVLEVFPEQETAVLSIKHLTENPFEKYSVDTIVKCKIKKVLKTVLIVELEKDIEGIITKKEAVVEQKDLSKELKMLYKPGQVLDAVIVYVDEKKQRIELSIRKLEKIVQQQLLKKYSEVKLPTLKDILTEQ